MIRLHSGISFTDAVLSGCPRFVFAVVLIGMGVCSVASQVLAEGLFEDANVQVTDVDGKSILLTSQELKEIPTISIEVSDRQGTPHLYSGIPLPSLLKRAGIPLGEELRKEKMTWVVVVEARDEYRVAFSIAELDANFSDRMVLLTGQMDGKPLADDEGPLRLVIPSEKRKARWVRMVERIRIVDASRLPETSPSAD